MLPDSTVIRAATEPDAEACAAIYAPYVRDTCITFELEPPSPTEMAGRIAAASADHAWLVIEDAGRVFGYAYGHQLSQRAAYRWSCESSIYVEPGRRRTGAGRALYGALLGQLTGRGYLRFLAAIALPNDASTGLHRALGFEEVGTLRRIGWKHGQWRDVCWMEKSVSGDDPPPAALH